MSWFTSSPLSQRRALALTALVTATAGPLHAQTLSNPPPKRVRVEDKNAPRRGGAEQIGGRPERELTLDTNVELVRGQPRLTAHSACFRIVEDEVSANGDVRLGRL